MSTMKVNAILDAAGGNTTTVNGVTPALASQAEAEAGSNNTKLMTPLRVAQAVTAQVGTATAALAYGAVGTYGLFSWSGATQRGPGSTVSGSSLFPANTFAYNVSAGYAFYYGQPSGTWRLMGATGLYDGTNALNRVDMYTSVFMRIS